MVGSVRFPQATSATIPLETEPGRSHRRTALGGPRVYRLTSFGDVITERITPPAPMPAWRVPEYSALYSTRDPDADGEARDGLPAQISIMARRWGELGLASDRLFAGDPESTRVRGERALVGRSRPPFGPGIGLAWLEQPGWLVSVTTRPEDSTVTVEELRRIAESLMPVPPRRAYRISRDSALGDLRPDDATEVARGTFPSGAAWVIDITGVGRGAGGGRGTDDVRAAPPLPKLRVAGPPGHPEEGLASASIERLSDEPLASETVVKSRSDARYIGGIVGDRVASVEVREEGREPRTVEIHEGGGYRAWATPADIGMVTVTARAADGTELDEERLAVSRR